MAFDSTIIVVGKPYDNRLPAVILDITNRLLTQFGIRVEKQVDMKEYENMTSSKEINRYIRVRKRTLQQQKSEATELVKVGTSRVQAFERFASAKYAFVSVSDMEDSTHTVIWFSFHSRLSNAFPEFHDFSYLAARDLSVDLATEGYALEVSSFSRNSDKFVLYVGGRERHKLSTKGALTEVKKLYGLDINVLMLNVDKNMAIHYAPADHREVTEEVRTQEKRYTDWKQHRDEIKIENKEDGSNLMDTFEKENEIIMNTLKQRQAAVETALRTDPIGRIIYFKMADVGVAKTYVSENERLFGREVNKNVKTKA